MEFNKTIAARQSVRKFTEAQITDEQLKAILEAANAAPACMGQYDHLHLTVVQNRRSWYRSMRHSRRQWVIRTCRLHMVHRQ